MHVYLISNFHRLIVLQISHELRHIILSMTQKGLQKGKAKLLMLKPTY